MKYLIVVLTLFVSSFVYGMSDIPEEILSAAYRTTCTTTHESLAVGEDGKITVIQQPAIFSCSGTAIDARHVLSAGHCAAHNKEGAKFMLDIFDVKTGKLQRSIPMHPVKLAEEMDLSLFETDEDIPHFRAPKFADAQVGHCGVVIGAAHGWSPYHCAWGVFAALEAETDRHQGEMAACSWKGASGGGVYDADWNFVGVLVAGAESTIFFVPAKIVKSFLENNAEKIEKHDTKKPAKKGWGEADE